MSNNGMLDGTEVLTPITPTSWLMARLRESQSLLDLLGNGAFPTTNQQFTPGTEPIYQSGQVPDGHPARFVVVRPPEVHSQDYYADESPRSQNSTYLIYAETQSDKLPAGHDLDMVLDPIFREIIRAVKGVRIPDAIGGKVHECCITQAYTPQALTLTTKAKLKQVGVQLILLSTV